MQIVKGGVRDTKVISLSRRGEIFPVLFELTAAMATSKIEYCLGSFKRPPHP
jgi:hypothetical protein